MPSILGLVLTCREFLGRKESERGCIARRCSVQLCIAVVNSQVRLMHRSYDCYDFEPPFL